MSYISCDLQIILNSKIEITIPKNKTRIKTEFLILKYYYAEQYSSIYHEKLFGNTYFCKLKYKAMICDCVIDMKMFYKFPTFYSRKH